MTTAERTAAAVAAMQAILDHEEVGDITCNCSEAQDAIVALADALDGLQPCLPAATAPPNSDQHPPAE